VKGLFLNKASELGATVSESHKKKPHAKAANQVSINLFYQLPVHQGVNVSKLISHKQSRPGFW